MAAAAIQCVVSALSMQRSYAGLKPTLSHTPPSVIGLATVLPLIILFLDETIRHHDRKKVPAYQPASLALINVYHDVFVAAPARDASACVFACVHVHRAMPGI